MSASQGHGQCPHWGLEKTELQIYVSNQREREKKLGCVRGRLKMDTKATQNHRSLPLNFIWAILFT